jgi:SAM-dependent methyltransferase
LKRKYLTFQRTGATQRNVLLTALLAQLGGAGIGAALFYAMPELLAMPLLAALVLGACAAIVSHALGAPRWWQPIHLAFAPLVLLGLWADLPPLLWLILFATCLAVFWRTDVSRVPLFLSNLKTTEAVAVLLPAIPSFVLDAGCGNGTHLARLAQLRPDCEFVGIEHAPATYLLARVLTAKYTNVHIRYGDFWKQRFTPFDVIYAFLSPVPMEALWQKACAEMRPGTRLISNSFAIDSVPASRVISVDDARQTQLYLYDLPTDPSDDPK